jgi:molecular chaperone GrpE
MGLIGPVTRLKDLFREKDTQAKEFKDKYLRALAELDNFRKRTEKDNEEFRRYAKVDFFVQILPVLENFNRAMDGAGENVRDNFFQGMEIICRQFKDTLGSMGLKEFSALGETFDPARHEAIGTAECVEKPENTIIEEVSKGYMVGAKVIKPARVIVSKLKREPEKEEEKPEEKVEMKEEREEEGGCEHVENNRD